MSTRFVTAATYRSAGAAHLARAQLADAGIDAMVVDEALSGFTPFHSSAGGSVKIRVPETDLEEAKAVLDTDEE